MRKIKLFALTLAFACVMGASAMAADFVKSKTYENNFGDVKETSWYAKNVASVYELGLMEGVTESTFDTESEMSVAQAITIAARLHSIYNDKEIPEVENAPRWFQKYVNYAIDNGIMYDGQFNSYTRSVLSYEMVTLFANALPKEHYAALNEITYIQDVPDNLIFHKDVLMFYNAGVLNGNDKSGTFLPMSAITRKRAAVILSRTALKEDRLTFSLDEKKDNYTAQEVLEIVDKQTVKDTLDNIIVANVGEYTVSAGEYRYYSSIANADKAKIENHIKNNAALYQLLVNSKLSVSYSEMAEILTNYYESRIASYGVVDYFTALEAQKITDASYAKILTLSDLYYHLIINKHYTITDDEVYNYAIENGYIRAKHILIQKDTEDAYRKILEINLDLLDGADFDKLLEKNGEDPGMKARKDGYFFRKGVMVPEFEDAAYSLEEGQISGIVETSYGYHIIKRLEFDRDLFVSSGDFASAKSEAASSLIYKEQLDIAQNVAVEYIDNIDEMAEILK